MFWPTVQFSRSGEKRLNAARGRRRSLKTKQHAGRRPRAAAISRSGRRFGTRLELKLETRTLQRPRVMRGRFVRLPRKEVIQPHLPVRLPCYDFTPIASPTFDGSLPCGLGHRLRVLPTFVV